MRAILAVPVVWLCACATAAIAPATPHANAASATTPDLVHAQTTQLARELGHGATYADLVRAARVLLRAQAADSSAECLLRRGASGYVLGADLLPALDPLPDAAVELDPSLQREAGLLGVLTAYGPMGSAQPALALCSFTNLAPGMAREAPLALMLTNEGVYVRRGDVPATPDDGPRPATAAIARALSSGEPAHTVIFVAAEASVPLDELAALLALLPQHQAVALAVPLPAGTKLPVPPSRASAHACPAGLPGPAPDSPEGDLDAKDIVAALGPLRSAAEACLTRARGPASAGGRLVLALRIAADGRTQQACLMEDAIGDATLAGCVIDAANALRFPAPTPKGFVDVHLPLALAPEAPPQQRALCE